MAEAVEVVKVAGQFMVEEESMLVDMVAVVVEEVQLVADLPMLVVVVVGVEEVVGQFMVEVVSMLVDMVVEVVKEVELLVVGQLTAVELVAEVAAG